MKKSFCRTERGWPAHFICAHDCHFRRNTLLEYGENRVVVSTVGAMVKDGAWDTVGKNRFYETMVFHAMKDDMYWDADIHAGEISFESEWAVRKMKKSSDKEANDMHEAVCKEFERRMLAGEIFPRRETPPEE